MADFDLEQLKTIFENLGEKLDKTQGDNLTREEIIRLRMIMEKMSRITAQAARQASKKPATQASPASPASDTKTIISQFMDEWKKSESKNKKEGNKGQAPKGTILLEEEAKSRRTIIEELKDQKSETQGLMGSFKNLKSNLDKTSDKLSGWMKNLKNPAALGGLGAAGGGIAGNIVGAAGERIDNYRNLIAQGEGEINSIQEFTNVVNSAAMSTEELVKAMESGGQGVRQLGGIKYAQLTANITRSTRAFGNLAMSFEQRGEVINSFLEIQSSRGNIRGIENDQERMTQGILDIVESSRQTSHILGLTRKEALDRAKEQAQDAATGAIIRNMNLDERSVTSASTQVQQVFGPAGEKLLKQLVAGVAPQGEAAQLAALNPEAYRSIQAIADRLRTGGEVSEQETSRRIRDFGQRTRGTDYETFQAQLAIAGTTPYQESLIASLEASNKALNLRTDAPQDPNADAGTNAVLGIEGANREIAAAARQAFDTGFNSILDTVGPAMDSFVQELANGAQGVQQFLLGLEGYPKTMTAITLGGLALVGGFTVLGGAVKILSGIMGGAGGLLTKIFGAGGAGGGSILGRLLGGLRGIGGGAGGLLRGALPIAGGLLGGATVGIGGMLLGSSQINNRQNESFFGSDEGEGGFFGSRATGYLTSIGSGAAGGALIGAGFGGIGALPGAVLGGLAGLGTALYSDFSGSGPATKTQSSSSTPNTSANATGQTTRATLSIDQMTNRMMIASERSAELLRQLKENSDAQLNLTREEVSVLRDHSNRVIRLLEQGNRNTRMIAETST